MGRIANWLSIFLHPLLLPFYLVICLCFINSFFALMPTKGKVYICFITVLFVTVFPALSVLVFKKIGLIEKINPEKGDERVFPMLTMILSVFIGLFLIHKVPYSNGVSQLFLLLIIIFSVFSVITIKWKISLHMTVIGAICSFLLILGYKHIADTRIVFMFFVLLSGLLGSSRLYLQKNNPAQIYAGFGLGFFIVVWLL